MITGKRKSRFESEVHLGLMVIVFLLLLLNFTSNLILHRARGTLEEKTLGRVRTAALAVSRLAQQKYPERLSATALDNARQEHALSGLTLAPLLPAESTPEARRAWFRSTLNRMPADQLPEVAEKLFAADYLELTRGKASEYYYLYPIPAGAGHDLLILSIDQPDLAYLDDSRRIIIFAQIAALGIVGIVYVLLSRMIFHPFRRLKRHAEEAGRLIDVTANETEAIVKEYERVIEQLRANEAELLRLNEAIQDRADSFESFNRYLLDSSTSGVLTFSPSGQVISANDASVRLLHLYNCCAGRELGDLLAHLPGLRRDVEQALSDEDRGGYREYVGLFADAPDTVLGVTITAITDRTKGAEGVLLFINDLTELARLTRELESKKRLVALGEMAGGLAHQLRNALGAISGYANLLKKRLSAGGLPPDHAEALVEETRQAESLISRFLTFARPLQCALEKVDLSRVVKEAVAQFKVRETEHPVEFRLDLQDDLVVNADPVLLKQVFGNIIDNAIHAYGSGSVLVEISSSGMESGDAVVIVADHGCGIVPENLERIFTPFFSSRPSGTGLGLSLAQRIVDLHGGRLRVESQPDEGTRFEIFLPLAGNPAISAVHAESAIPT
jgi:signal transduction histidine kinase